MTAVPSRAKTLNRPSRDGLAADAARLEQSDVAAGSHEHRR
jgi:hypothetical protein